MSEETKPKKNRSDFYLSADGTKVYKRKNTNGKLGKYNPFPKETIGKIIKQKNILRDKETESDAQKAIVTFCRALEQFDPRYKLFNAVPNQIKNPRFIGIYKAEGLRTGFPDMQLCWQSIHYGGLYLELKCNYNKPSEEQIVCLKTLALSGHFACVAYGSSIGVDTIRNYMSNGFGEMKQRLSEGHIPVFGYKGITWITGDAMPEEESK